jgi:hypothetical protein
MSEAYCEECRFFRSWRRSVTQQEECAYEDNMTHEIAKANWRHREYEYVAYKKAPSILNAHNDCAWFEALPE